MGDSTIILWEGTGVVDGGRKGYRTADSMHYMFNGGKTIPQIVEDFSNPRDSVTLVYLDDDSATRKDMEKIGNSYKGRKIHMRSEDDLMLGIGADHL